MRTRTTAGVAIVLTASALLGWMDGLGRSAYQPRRSGTNRSRTRRRADSPILPVPDAPFGGVIGRKAKESTPGLPKDVTAPAGAPNVLLIMTDDTGFGATSTFGGPIPTPNFDRVAKSG
jgi:arylsulfatase